MTGTPGTITAGSGVTLKGMPMQLPSGYFQGASVQGSTSPTFTVKVRTKVTSALADASLRKGQTLVLTGRTTPVKAGYSVTLQRYVNGRWVNLKTGMTSATGTYRLTKTVTSKGNWKMRARVAGGGGNLYGTSLARIARVS